MRVTAVACSNVALVKYWGKRGVPELNLPAVGSISIALGSLRTSTSIELTGKRDRFVLNGKEASGEHLARVVAQLDRIRSRVGSSQHASVDSANDFPTGAGLASSASGMAALTLAACRAFGVDLPPRELSIIARHGSGSAARSIFGGFVEMQRGHKEDGSDAYAAQLAPPDHWPLRVVIAVTASEAKAISSRSGMKLVQTSPFYTGWVASQIADLDAARRAIERRDFDQLADVTEHSCLKMHALAQSGRPPLLYWKPATFAAIDCLRRLRDSGVPVTYTIDAGPQVKAICLPDAAERVAQALSAVDGVQRVLSTDLGGPARLV